MDPLELYFSSSSSLLEEPLSFDQSKDFFGGNVVEVDLSRNVS